MTDTDAPKQHQPAALSPAASEDVLKEASVLLSQLDRISRYHAQAPAKIIAIAILCFTVLVSFIVAHAFWAHYTGASGVAAPWATLLNGLLLAGITAFFWRRTELTYRAGLVLILCTGTVFSVALWFNHHMAVYTVPAAVVIFHILGPARVALAASLVSLSASAALALLMPPAMDFPVLLRIMADGLIAMVVLQIMVSQRQYLSQAAQAVTERLQTMVNALQRDLNVAEQERDRAITLDPQSGLLTPAAFEAVLVQALAARPVYAAAVLVLVRLDHVEEFLAPLNAEEQTIFLENIIARLREQMQPRLLARRGRWEFAAMLELPSTDAASRKLFADRLARLSQPVLMGVRSVPLFPCVGVASWLEPAESAVSLVRCAEIALLVASDTHRADPIWFEQRMETSVFGRAAMAQSIDRAILHNEFELVYQPIIQISGRSLQKVEALIRWNDPVKGRISPADFIPLAEAYGKIVPLTRWVMMQAVKQVHLWRKTLGPEFQISVNMPPAFLEWFADQRTEALAWLNALGSPQKGLVLEITEGAFLNVTPAILEVLALFKDMGFLIALDDFGVGYSCFGQLDRLPLDTLKIDKSLVDHIESTPSKRTVCSTIIKMGHELGFTVVAEGVETPGQAHLLADDRCDFIQGYVFAKPMSVQDLEAFALRHGSHDSFSI